MSIITHYTTLATSASAEFKDKGSRFIAHAFPIVHIEDIKLRLETIREANHKARHCCYAWRLGIDGNYFRTNDDGEPAGSAGRPILGQIDSAGLSNVLVIVVRYFGGTLLGVPGLIHAYKTAAAQALLAAVTIEQNICKKVLLRCDYSHLSEALRIAKQYNAEVLQQNLQLDCHLLIAIPLTQYEFCTKAWLQTRVMTLTDNLQQDVNIRDYLDIAD